jgi:IS5 family transposase
MKARIGVVADTGGYAGYSGVAKRREHNGRTVKRHIAERRSTTEKRPEGRLKRLTEELETLKARLNERVEHSVRVLKRQFGSTSVRCCGMAKNAAQVPTLFALSNLLTMRRRMLPTAGEVRL